MAKQHLEKYLSKTLKQKDVWWIKLQVMPLAKHKTPADYIIISHNFRYLIECKERKLCNNRARFSFDELTQEASLVEFERKFALNKSYVLLMFWNTTIKNSDIYLIPIEGIINYRTFSGKKSINNTQACVFFSEYKIPALKGGIIDLSFFIL